MQLKHADSKTLMRDPHTCYLYQHDCDNSGLRTPRTLCYCDPTGTTSTIGKIKIIKRGMGAKPIHASLPHNSFHPLNKDFCSHGMSKAYYDILGNLNPIIREEILVTLKDCVYDQDIYEHFRDEKGMITSSVRDEYYNAMGNSYNTLAPG